VLQFRAPEAVADVGQDAAHVRFGFAQLRCDGVLVAHVAEGDERQRFGLDVQARDGHVDGDPDALLAGAQKEAVLAVEGDGLLAGAAQVFVAAAAVAAVAEPVRRRRAHDVLARQADQPFRHRVDVHQLFVVWFVQEQAVAGLRKERLAQACDFDGVHTSAVSGG